MARKIGKRTVTVIRGGRVDRLSDDAPSTTEHDVKGCAILPRATEEEGKGWVVREGWQVIAPHDADVTADDKVRVDGEVFSVDGQVARYENLQGVGKAAVFYVGRLG